MLDNIFGDILSELDNLCEQAEIIIKNCKNNEENVVIWIIICYFAVKINPNN